jgi:hypothetical protein
LEKIARFEKLENLSSVFQNGLAFLGRIGKALLCEFPEIYGLSVYVHGIVGSKLESVQIACKMERVCEVN